MSFFEEFCYIVVVPGSLCSFSSFAALNTSSYSWLHQKMPRYIYNSSHAGMQHCKLGFGCSYHVITEKVVLIGFPSLDEENLMKAKFGVIGFTFCSD
jgi:hypothetical protein